jgi:hypothetical protein
MEGEGRIIKRKSARFPPLSVDRGKGCFFFSIVQQARCKLDHREKGDGKWEGKQVCLSMLDRGQCLRVLR